MNNCNVCKVNVHPQHGVCPLCGKRLGTPGVSATAYPVYTDNGNSNGFTLGRLLLFLVIAVSVVSGFINVAVSGFGGTLWSVIVIASLVSTWLLFLLTFSKRVSTGGKILNSYIIISLFLIAIDILSGFGKWSTTYVIPFLTIGITMVFTIIAVSNNAHFKDYLGYLIGIFFISLCPVFIFIFSLSTQAWTGFAAVIYCVLTVVGLIIFQADNFKREIIKQFHF